MLINLCDSWSASVPPSQNIACLRGQQLWQLQHKQQQQQQHATAKQQPEAIKRHKMPANTKILHYDNFKYLLFAISIQQWGTSPMIFVHFPRNDANLNNGISSSQLLILFEVTHKAGIFNFKIETSREGADSSVCGKYECGKKKKKNEHISIFLALFLGQRTK